MSGASYLRETLTIQGYDKRYSKVELAQVTIKMEGIHYPRIVAIVDDYMLQEYAIFALDLDKGGLWDFKSLHGLAAFLPRKYYKWSRGPRQRKVMRGKSSAG